MQRIDILGVSGVGKSLLARALLAEKRIASPGEARLAASRAYVRENSDGLVSLFQKSWRTLPVVRRTRFAEFISMEEKDCFRAFVETNPCYFIAIRRGFWKCDPQDVRSYDGLYYALNTARQVALLERWYAGGYVLFHESLSQKVYAIVPWSLESLPIVTDYFGSLPLPKALIHLEAEPEEVLRRVRERESASGRTRLGHRHLNDDALLDVINVSMEFARIGLRVLESRGTRVIALNNGCGQTSIGNLAETVFQALGIRDTR